MKITTASIDDINVLAKLFDEYRVFYGKPSDIEGAVKFLKERISKNESVAFIAYNENNNPVGFTHLYPLWSSTRMAKFWLLNDLFVAARYRKLGAGEALLERAKQLVKDSGACGMMLETAADNLPAQSLYFKNGWEKDNGHYYFTWDAVSEHQG
jgi:GNAT superfamily N-acetyltransferase